MKVLYFRKEIYLYQNPAQDLAVLLSEYSWKNELRNLVLDICSEFPMWNTSFRLSIRPSGLK